ncbi:MAG: VOC family protein [Pseudohongiella sp.]|jgi:catechol 2,3-dioxygenase-like lactoylglutathione lyase family enzyme|nr:VOC family protein [Pseudohongiella sp.]
MKFLSSLLCLALLSSLASAQLASPNPAGLTYGHVHLNVSDIELHKQIWVEHFNGVVVEKGPLTAVRLPNMLVALTAKAPTMGTQATVMDHFGFKVRNMDAFLAKWRAAGLEVGRIFIGAEGQTNAYIMLPDDVYVEMQEDQGLSEEITGYHIHFILPDAEELLAWYTDIFSLEVKPRGSIATTTNAPGMNISFGNSNTPRLPTKGASLDHIGFEFDDLEAFCKQLEAKGIVFDVPFRDIPSIGLKIAYITDPAGTYIELTQGYDEF